MATKPSSIIFILFATLLTSSAQALYKFGVRTTNFYLDAIFNFYFIAATLLYVAAGIIAIISFREGDVSILYPLFATSYIWVSLLSIYFFSETINSYKWIGIAVIIAGVIFIGLGNKKMPDLSGAWQ